MALAGRIRRLLKADPDLTVEQIAGALGVGAGKVERAMPALKNLTPRNAGGSSASTPTPPTPTPSEEPIGLTVGDRVTTSTRQAGVIVSSRPIDGGGFEYLVFWGPGDESWYNGTQLIPIRTPHKRQIVGPEDLIKNLALLKMRRRFNDVLYSYQASRTVMQPHQFRPAVKFLENPSHRLLIADEVGLGKTIEAGIIFLELKARTDLDRFLVVCPSRLREKWQAEFHDRFGERLENMDKTAFKRFLDKIEQGESPRLQGVVAIEAIRDQAIIDRIAELPIHFDLVVIDEAHHLRNRGTLTNELGHALEEAADAMLLLSATPINLGNEDLFQLLNILLEGEFPDHETFEAVLEPAQTINQAIRLLGDPGECLDYLGELSNSSVGNKLTQHPDYMVVKSRLETGNPMTRDEIIRMRRTLASISPISQVFSRTRKKEVPDSGALRDAKILPVNLTEAEHAFYEEYMEYVRLSHLLKNRSTPLGFALMMKERQVASCLPAVILSLDNDTSKDYEGLDSELDYDSDEVSQVASSGSHETIQQQLSESLAKLNALGQEIGTADSKLEAFLKSLEGIRAETPEAKVIVFSSFKGTLKYLRQRLIEQAWIHGGVKLITGDVKIDERASLIKGFETASGFSVLLMSEVGSEGLDLQFTDIMLNYDLPWNPMRVEQRIGRIDRYGQRSEKVRIYSLLLADTIEERILERLYRRIGIFEESIGDLEPILGGVIRGLTREIFSAKLSSDEQDQSAERALDAILSQKNDRAMLDEKEDQFIGNDLLLQQEAEARINNGKVLSSKELLTLVRAGLSKSYNGGSYLLSEIENGYFTFKAHADFRADLRRFCRETRSASRMEERMFRDLEQGRMRITFEGDSAHRDSEVHLINSHHPLTQFAISKLANDSMGDNSIGVVQSTSSVLPVGAYCFFVHSLEVEGVESRVEFVTIVLDESGEVRSDLADKALGSIIEADDVIIDPPNGILDHWDEHRERANREISMIRDEKTRETQARNDALIEVRRVAIENTYQAKISRTQQRIAMGSNAFRRRMDEGKLAKLAVEKDGKIRQLIEERQRVGVGSNLLLQGIIVADEINDSL